MHESKGENGRCRHAATYLAMMHATHAAGFKRQNQKPLLYTCIRVLIEFITTVMQIYYTPYL